MIIGDYHTHTIFSHGKGSIEENVERARELGLKEIAITDHGLSHIVFGLSKRKVQKMRVIIDGLQGKYSDIKILLGVEANLISEFGDVDIKGEEWDYFDIVLCGFHKMVWSNSFSQQFKFIGKNDILGFIGKNKSEKLKKTNTAALIRAMQKNKIDVISHPNHDMLIDAVEVAKAARDCGVFFELNSKKVHLDFEQLSKVADTGVQFIINSDAHSMQRVGDFELALQVAKNAGISPSQIANFDNIPKFRNRG